MQLAGFGFVPIGMGTIKAAFHVLSFQLNFPRPDATSGRDDRVIRQYPHAADLDGSTDATLCAQHAKPAATDAEDFGGLGYRFQSRPRS